MALIAAETPTHSFLFGLCAKCLGWSVYDHLPARLRAATDGEQKLIQSNPRAVASARFLKLMDEHHALVQLAKERGLLCPTVNLLSQIAGLPAGRVVVKEMSQEQAPLSLAE